MAVLGNTQIGILGNLMMIVDHRIELQSIMFGIRIVIGLVNGMTRNQHTKLLPSECNPRDQNDISSQNASKREQKKPDFVKRD